MIDGHEFDAEFDRIEEELMSLASSNRAKLKAIMDNGLDAHHGGGQLRAMYLLGQQRKLAIFLKTFDWMITETKPTQL